MAEGRLQDRAGGALVREGGQVTCEEAQEKWWFNADDDDNGDHFHAWSDVGGGKSDNGDEEHNDFAAKSEVKKNTLSWKNWKPLGFKLCKKLSVLRTAYLPTDMVSMDTVWNLSSEEAFLSLYSIIQKTTASSWRKWFWSKYFWFSKSLMLSIVAIMWDFWKHQYQGQLKSSRKRSQLKIQKPGVSLLRDRWMVVYRYLSNLTFLAVQYSSIGDLVTDWLTDWDTFWFWHTKSDPRDLWPLRHLIRVMRRHDLRKSLTILEIF